MFERLKIKNYHMCENSFQPTVYIVATNGIRTFQVHQFSDVYLEKIKIISDK